jgi:hypothetical protein
MIFDELAKKYGLKLGGTNSQASVPPLSSEQQKVLRNNFGPEASETQKQIESLINFTEVKKKDK